MLANFGGREAQELAKLIKGNTRLFKHLPIGPIGAQLSLHEDYWAQAAESAIGNTFNDYIVDNAKDHATLSASPVRSLLPGHRAVEVYQGAA